MSEAASTENQHMLTNAKPVSLGDIMVKVNGKTFRCECGCNVFRHPYDPKTQTPILDKYNCNGCGTTYTGT